MQRFPELLGLDFFGQTLNLHTSWNKKWGSRLDRKYAWLEPFYNIYDALYSFMFTIIWPLIYSEVVTQGVDDSFEASSPGRLYWTSKWIITSLSTLQTKLLGKDN